MNNFRDGHKQDALDLVTGTYTVMPGEQHLERWKGSPSRREDREGGRDTGGWGGQGVGGWG